MTFDMIYETLAFLLLGIDGRDFLERLEQLFRLDGKVAVVTGGYGGIGEVVVRGLAQMGAKLAIAGQNGEKDGASAQGLQKKGHEAFASTFNVFSLLGNTRSDSFGFAWQGFCFLLCRQGRHGNSL
jgi:short chain dehydrogenase